MAKYMNEEVRVRHNNHYNLDTGGGFLISPSLWLVVHPR